MRNTDDQLKIIMERASDVKKKKAAQKAAVPYAISACACLVLLVMTSFKLADFSAKGLKGASGHYGSLLLNTSYMGYVVIAMLAFLLGVFTTLLLLNIRRSREWGHDHS